jgi:mRNA interferase RelE/StbE
MFKLSIHKKAAKYYQTVDDNTAGKINRVLEEVSRNPFTGADIKKLHGRLAGKYRVRVGDLRIIYTVDNASEMIMIEAMGPRGSVYK